MILVPTHWIATNGRRLWPLQAGLKLYLDALGVEKQVKSDDDRRILCEYHEGTPMSG